MTFHNKFTCNECSREITEIALYSGADGELYCEECFFEVLHYEDEQIRLMEAY